MEMRWLSGEHLWEFQINRKTIINCPDFASDTVIDYSIYPKDLTADLPTYLSPTLPLSDFLISQGNIKYIYDYGANWTWTIACTDSEKDKKSDQPIVTYTKGRKIGEDLWGPEELARLMSMLTTKQFDPDVHETRNDFASEMECVGPYVLPVDGKLLVWQILCG